MRLKRATRISTVLIICGIIIAAAAFLVDAEKAVRTAGAIIAVLFVMAGGGYKTIMFKCQSCGVKLTDEAIAEGKCSHCGKGIDEDF